VEEGLEYQGAGVARVEEHEFGLLQVAGGQTALSALRNDTQTSKQEGLSSPARLLHIDPNPTVVGGKYTACYKNDRNLPFLEAIPQFLSCKGYSFCSVAYKSQLWTYEGR